MNSLYNFWADSRVKTADKIKTDYIAKHPKANPDNVLVCTEDRPDLQEDTLEGVTGYTEKDIHLDEILGEHVFTDYLYRPVGMKYCNVLCFYTIRFTIEMPTMLNLPQQERNNYSYVGYVINDNMQGLGKYIAIITDLDEFIRRVRKKVDENNFIYAAGPVHYNRMKCKGEISSVYEKPHILIGSDEVIDLKDLPDLRLTRDCFNKDVKYKSQNEWRIALYRGSKDTNAYRLEVGDLSEIYGH